jgi:hypothetical protein
MSEVLIPRARRKMGRPVGSTHPGLVDRLKRYQMQERYAELIDAHGHAFAEDLTERKNAS